MKALLYLEMTLILVGCGDVITVTAEVGPSFQDAWMSSDKEGANRVTSYQPTDTIYVKADLVRVETGTEVAASFVAVKVDHPDVPPNTEIDVFIQKFDGTLNRVNFDISNDGPLPSGSYKIDMSIAGKLTKTLTFTIPPESSP